MKILNIIALFCFILVNGDEIRIEKGSINLPPITAESTPTVFKNETNEDKPQYNCSSSQMTVTGYDIKFSDIVQHECWLNASDIQIFALNKILIDCDVIKNSAQLSVYAPTWETVGTRKIILNGKDGESHKISTPLNNGRNGEPGLPGEAGGIFIGFVEQLINASKLSIEVNGGNGGPGQNGAKGFDGINGDEFENEFTETKCSRDDFVKYLYEHNLNFSTRLESLCGLKSGCLPYWIYEINGKTAFRSFDGGDGGAGGLGGPAGFIHLTGFVNMPNMKIDYGKNGMAGNGGSPGDPAFNGRTATCRYYYSMLPVNTLYCTWSDFTMGSVGKNGIDGDNKLNRKQPSLAMSSKYSDARNSFKQFVRLNLVKNE